MKRCLAAKPRSTTPVYEPSCPLCGGRDGGGSANCQVQRPYHPEFDAANLRLRVKISRVLRDFHARFIGLTPKTHE